MTTTNWLTAIKDAEKTCIIQNDLRKVHFKFADGREMVEEYNLDTNVVVRRAWKVTKRFGSQSKWEVEIGYPDMLPIGDTEENVGITESLENPITNARITKNCLEWRIRNLRYPLDNYIVTVDPDDGCIIVKTKNKKFFKKIIVHDLKRIGVKLNQQNLDVKHEFSTLIISYKKPHQLILSEKLIFEEVSKLKTVQNNEQCKIS